MHITLLVPDLLLPRELAAEASRDLPLPALQTLLAKGRRHVELSASPETTNQSDWLLARFGIEPQQDLPVAALTALTDGLEAGSGYWLRADPTHLKLNRDRLVLTDASQFDVSPAEAAELVAHINRHLTQDGKTLLAPHPRRWYLRLDAPPDLVTTLLESATGNNIDHHRPTGADAMHWQRLMNEIQMLLHEHPVNEKREAAGRPAVNSVWFWGGGTLPQVSEIQKRAFDSVSSDGDLALALAHTAGIPGVPLAATVELLLQDQHSGRTLVTHGALQAAIRDGNLHAWREAMAQLERDWFAPLLAHLQDGSIGMVTLVMPGADGIAELEVAGNDLRKFWRRVKPLAEFR